MRNSQTEILEQFIVDEDLHFTNGEQGLYWPRNHHIITPLVGRAPKLLPEDRCVDLYFHLLRLDYFPATKSPAEFNRLLEAYARLIPLFHRGYPYCVMRSPKGLFLFGYDDEGHLSGVPQLSYESLVGHLKFWRYADSFWHMPGMLKKQHKFLELSSDSVLLDRVTKTLLRVNPVRDLIGTELWFWSLLLLAIQGKSSGTVVVEWYLDVFPPSHRSFCVESLARYLRASAREDLLSKFKVRLSLPNN